MKTLRFHVVALPHLATNKINCACAYSMKVLNFCKMMMSLGHEVYHYGAEGSDVECTEHIQIISKIEQDLLLGEYDYKTQLPNHFKFDPIEPAWVIHNKRAAAEINKRKKPRDFLCLIAGVCQAPIWQAAGADMACVEYGIGYGGTFAPYRCYESYAHRAKCAGRTGDDPSGDYYHVVIPNYYDPADFPYVDVPRKDYLMFIGRLTGRKGLEIALGIAEEVKKPLYICGQGARYHEVADPIRNTPAVLTTDDGITFKSDWIRYQGHVDAAQRAVMMREAQAVIVPTIYLEPFGGVAVEAQMCGTPVITTDWGAFPETVDHGVTGYRCYTLEQFVWAARNLNKFNRREIWTAAHKRWSIYTVRDMYQEYFRMVYDTWDPKGWYALRYDRENLDWLAK